MWRGGGPSERGQRGDPARTKDTWGSYNDEMEHFCIDRHNGFVNHLFMDWSVRTVGLKELWTLKWHKHFQLDGPWTTQGGVASADWPDWMSRFKDY
jgi:hypothetical protein